MSVCSRCPESRESPVWAEAAAVLSIPALPQPPSCARGPRFSAASGEQSDKNRPALKPEGKAEDMSVLWAVYTAMRSIRGAVPVGRLKWPQVPWLVWALSQGEESEGSQGELPLSSAVPTCLLPGAVWSFTPSKSQLKTTKGFTCSQPKLGGFVGRPSSAGGWGERGGSASFLQVRAGHPGGVHRDIYQEITC